MKQRKESIRRAFARAAATYDQAALIQHSVVQQLVELLPEKSASQILEIGCGTGNLTATLHGRFPNAAIVAVDLCAEMIATAQQKIDSANIRWEVADGERLLTPNGHYDLITSSGAFQWFDDLHTAIRRYAEWLTSDGQIVFAIFGPKTFCELQTVWSRVRRNDPPLPAAGFLSQEQLFNCLRSVFDEVSIRRAEYQFHHENLIALMRHLRATGTVGANRPAITRATLDALESAYLGEYDVIQTTYEVFFCSASLPRALTELPKPQPQP